MRFPPIRGRHVCVLSISSSFVPASSVRPLLMSSTIRNRFANEDKQGTTEVRNVALGPKVYEGERYGKMSERLKRHNIQIKGNDRNPRFYGFLVGFVLLILIFLWVQVSGVMRSRRVANY